MTETWKYPEPTEHVRCEECGRRRATEHDEAIHNTGECGCDESRSLCWFHWNGGFCLPLSIYDPNSSRFKDDT